MELLELLEEFSKSNKTSNFIHIHSVDAEMFHTEGRTNGRKDRDRQTYMTKLIFTFISFVKAPKNEAILIWIKKFPYPNLKLNPESQRYGCADCSGHIHYRCRFTSNVAQVVVKI